MRAFKPLAERFWPKVEKTATCWIWQGAKDSRGYGSIGTGGRAGSKVKAHRAAYEMVIGPIPEGSQLDHLCRVRACVNPSHLEPVTNRENSLRGESPGARVIRTGQCLKGHEMTEENTRRRNSRPGNLNGRSCRECDRIRRRETHIRAGTGYTKERGATKYSKTGVRGVHFSSQRNRFIAHVRVGKCTVHYSRHLTIEAATAAVAAARAAHTRKSAQVSR